MTTGIGEALYSTATGLAIAIFSLIFYRLFQAFVVNQVKVFRKAGNDLEILYLQSPPDFSNSNVQKSRVDTSTPRDKDKFSEPTTAIPPEPDSSEPKDINSYQ